MDLGVPAQDGHAYPGILDASGRAGTDAACDQLLFKAGAEGVKASI